MPDDRNRHSLDRRRAFHVWVAPCDRNSSDRRDGNVDLLLNGRGRVKEFIRQGYEGSVVLRGLLASECDAFEALEFADGLLDVAKQAAAETGDHQRPNGGCRARSLDLPDQGVPRQRRRVAHSTPNA